MSVAATRPGAELHYFAMLSREQQEDAIRRMNRNGWSDHGIAAAARISVEQIRQILRRNPDQESGQ